MQRSVNGPDHEWLTMPEVCQWLGGIGDSTLKKLIRDGKFPPGVRISHNTVRWNWMDVVAYSHMAQRLAGMFGNGTASAGDDEDG
jgi:predicted DNA-binding transcriptional regulator AlpA